MKTEEDWIDEEEKDLEIDDGSVFSQEPTKKQISLLLGAGFSVPIGYPTGEEMKERLLAFDKNQVFFMSGEMCNYVQGQRRDSDERTGYMDCCAKLIKYYGETHDFDYEEFFEHLKNKEFDEGEYKIVDEFAKKLNKQRDYIIPNLPSVYQDMVKYLLKDKNGKSWYDICSKEDEYILDEYKCFTDIMGKLKQKNVIHVHTLNHDLLFEFLAKRIGGGGLSDGFDEYGSKYYRKLRCGKEICHCRLERYTERYNEDVVMLYKLHGSINYTRYDKTKSEENVKKYDIVKIKYGMGFYDVQVAEDSKKCYSSDWRSSSAEFLTGTKSKEKKYQDKTFYSRLIKKFETNLRHSEKLIIIGYGFHDKPITERILKYFKGDQIYIVNPYYDENDEKHKNTLDFVRKTGAKVLRKEIQDLNSSLFEKSNE